LKPGFQRVSKELLKALATGFKRVTKGFIIVFKAIQTGFLSYESFETP